MVGQFVDRVLGSPRLELLVEVDGLSSPSVEGWLYTPEGSGPYTGFQAVATPVTNSISVEFMFDGYPPAGWLEGILGSSGGVPGIAAVTLYYAEAASAYDDVSSLSFSSVSLTPLDFDGGVKYSV